MGGLLGAGGGKGYKIYWGRGLAPRSSYAYVVCAPVLRDNPRALARGLSTVQVDKPGSISLVP